MEKRNKKMVTFRLDMDLLDMLEELRRREGSMFYDRDKTWLFEYALRQTYEQHVKDRQPV